MKAGAASSSTDVAAEANSVSVPISDKKFKEGIRAANVFMVEGAGSTIRIPLDQTRAALDRLDNCLTKNSLHSRPTHLWPLLANRNVHRSRYPTSRIGVGYHHASSSVGTRKENCSTERSLLGFNNFDRQL